MTLPSKSQRADLMAINHIDPAASGSVAAQAQPVIIEVSRAPFSRRRAVVVALYGGR